MPTPQGRPRNPTTLRSLAPLVAAASLAACADPASAPTPTPQAARASATAGSIDFEPTARVRRAPGLSLDHEGPPPTGFVKYGTFFSTDVKSAGVAGMRNVGSANLALSGVSGTISRAYLYWHAVTNTENTHVLETVLVDGTPVTGSNIGFSDDNCWGYQNSQAWVADVTNLVRAKGNGTYALTGFGGNVPAFQANANGASLIVIYQDGSTANDRDVVLYHGNDSNMPNIYDANGWNVTLQDINYSGGAASMQLHVADGQAFDDGAVFVNGQTLLPAGPNFDGNTVPSANNGPANNGTLWDIRTFNAVPFLNPGNNDLVLTSGPGADCLALVAAIIDLPKGAAPTPPFIFVPNKVSLTLSKSINVYLFSTDAFDATAVNPAETRMYIDGNATGAPVAKRGVNYLTTTGDYNGDGRTDRLMTFLVADLKAAGLTTSSTSYVIADRVAPSVFEGVPDIPPQIVP